MLRVLCVCPKCIKFKPLSQAGANGRTPGPPLVLINLSDGLGHTPGLRLGLHDGTGQTLVMHRYGAQAFEPWHCGVAPYLCSRRKLVTLIDATEAKVQRFGRAFALSGVQLSSTLGAEGLYLLVSAFCNFDVVLGRARYLNALRRGREHSTERRAREDLTVRAMADQDSIWVYGGGKEDCAAMGLA